VAPYVTRASECSLRTAVGVPAALSTLAAASSPPQAGDHGADRARLAAGPQAVVLPIPGIRRPARLEENIGALDVELSPDDLGAIEATAAAAAVPIQGARYPAHLERQTGL
jgi:hypothetical protein